MHRLARMRCSCTASRSHSTTSLAAAAWMASAVPQAPAPSTQMRIAPKSPSGGAGDQPDAVAAVALRGLGLLRLVHGLEVHLGQQDRREAGSRADVGYDRAQVR